MMLLLGWPHHHGPRPPPGTTMRMFLIIFILIAIIVVVITRPFFVLVIIVSLSCCFCCCGCCCCCCCGLGCWCCEMMRPVDGFRPNRGHTNYTKENDNPRHGGVRELLDMIRLFWVWLYICLIGLWSTFVSSFWLRQELKKANVRAFVRSFQTSLRQSIFICLAQVSLREVSLLSYRSLLGLVGHFMVSLRSLVGRS